MTTRTDPHRPGSLIPGEYKFICSYGLPFALGDGDFDEGYNLDELAAAEEAHEFWQHPSFGSKDDRCSVCCARFKSGDVWLHLPTNQAIHLGHDCAHKYGLMVDRSAFELASERRKDARAVVIKRKENEKKRAAFLAANPGLEAALAFKHRIISDLAERFQRWCELSEKQVALALKIVHEASTRPAELMVAAPEGRIVIRGKIISCKNVESQFGLSTKITVKVTTELGAWLAWGTAPASLLVDQAFPLPDLKGREVEFSATLTHGKEPHFAFFKRPTKGRIITE